MSPTNILRRAGKRPGAHAARTRRPRAAGKREILIRAGTVSIRARLLDTPTADRIWQTLPIYTTAETWGSSIYFETPVETGREPNAKWSVAPGEIAFWVEEDRVLIAFGQTPISKAGEIRLPCPCNIWAAALDDVAALASVRPGERVAVLEADS
jgi:hypothetical protein